MREKQIHERGSFLRDAVFAASDGIVTTFAIVAGSVGAALDSKVVLVLGFANLFADGISMASGTYLGVQSKVDYEKTEGDHHTSEPSAFMQAVVTFFSFGFGGLFPLVPYVFGSIHAFDSSLVLVGMTLFVVGMIRSFYTKKSTIKSGFEMLFIGGFAALVAFLIGDFVDKLT